MNFKKEHLIISLLFFVIIIFGYIIVLTTISYKKECKTNKDCEPEKFSIEEVGKFFICEEGKCKTEISKNPENITCKTKDDCPYGYHCIDGKCWGFESKIPEISEQPELIPCQINDDCPDEYECIDGKCWGPE